MAKKKIEGWTANLNSNGVQLLVTVKAHRQRDAFRAIQRAFPKVIVDLPDQVQPTTLLPGHRLPEAKGREEYDWTNAARPE